MCFQFVRIRWEARRCAARKPSSRCWSFSQKMQVGSFFGSLRTSQTIEEHIKFVEPKCLELRVYSFDLRLCYSAWLASPRLLSSLRNLYEWTMMCVSSVWPLNQVSVSDYLARNRQSHGRILNGVLPIVRNIPAAKDSNSVKIRAPKDAEPGDILIIYIGGSASGNKIPSDPGKDWEDIIDIGKEDLNLKAYWKPYGISDAYEEFSIDIGNPGFNETEGGACSLLVQLLLVITLYLSGCFYYKYCHVDY